MEGKELAVAPNVGAWIETVIKKNHNDRQIVAPYVGAWIETDLLEALACYPLSHPTWVRGLKLQFGLHVASLSASHPTWVRGLKLWIVLTVLPPPRSHPTWVRGLKQEDRCQDTDG